ncbi:hypothetical protein SAMN05192561_11828 [Halopenitus malekzadehii]|uniref:Uncharacterized protein n=1 Tax=Halopenitus malekzadehii TaxID=1267564 RepID=A0A1H6JY66_9EURY|nr:hypothetical protein [Halopenitus malekzadehii]SEH64280.1 hypothetical protein SAMN05192561_11828 [Halopenitus malekzadehii]
MVSRRSLLVGSALLLVLLGVVLTSGTLGLGTAEPVVTLENQDDATYYVTAYTVEDADAAGFLNFEVRTEDGERRIVTYEELVWPGEYRNVTLVDDGIDGRSFVVEPGETTTKTIDGWSRGEMTIYIVERGPERNHTSSRTITCGRRGQTHSLTLEPTGSGGSSTCAGGFGWLFR